MLFFQWKAELMAVRKESVVTCWCASLRAVHSFSRPLTSWSKTALVELYSVFRVFRPAMSPSTDWRMASSVSNLRGTVKTPRHFHCSHHNYNCNVLERSAMRKGNPHYSYNDNDTEGCYRWNHLQSDFLTSWWTIKTLTANHNQFCFGELKYLKIPLTKVWINVSFCGC